MTKPKGGWTEAQKEKQRDNHRKWRAANPEKMAGYHRKQRLTRTPHSRHMERFKSYGLTEGDYAEMLSKQNHACAICTTDTPGGRGTWLIDHCHATGFVRGLLCANCNFGLGHFKDNPVHLQTAIEYLAQRTSRNEV